uniref:Proliferation-associated protein 2G4 n=1 Tax=Caligus clemensi TaxID=344056 RepID=C1C2J5_CALCM|nr:Proliferation-associated protein 2G4 [Caligus clemensi]
MGDTHRNETEDELPTISDDLVVTKYKMASEIVNRVLKDTVGKCIVGESVREICIWADATLLEETGKAFKKDRKLLKGIAFPCCISINNCICHFSPLASDPEVHLKDGDMVKIDMGAHIDGFIAVVAHTLVVSSSPDKKIEGSKADALLAAHYASEAALRLVRPGNDTYTITDAVQKIAESYSCKPVEDMLSHQLEQNTINGEKTIIQNPSEGQRKEHEKYEFGLHEVYAIDVLISTGEGQGRAKDPRGTVYKKTDETYMLKMKHSREFYTAITKKHGNMPFTLRSMESESKARMGVVECISPDLVEPFQVLYEKDNELVGQFKFPVLLMPNGPLKIPGLPFDPETCVFDKKNEDLDI